MTTETRQRQRFGGAVSESASMRQLFDALSVAALETTPLLFVGEQGVGKQLLARAIWTKSRHTTGPFTVIDGASSDLRALDWDLGEKTGAAFQRAAGGVLFIRNVDELPVATQDAVACTLQTSTATGGAMANASIAARVIASSRRDVMRETEAGRFSPHLLRTLAPYAVAVPALRFRMDDIGCLVGHFLERDGIDRERVSSAAIQALASHDWPGNVRELAQVVERFRPKLLTPNADDGERTATHHHGHFDARKSFGEQRKEQEALFEQHYVRWLLARHGGNLSAAAREARMDRKHLRDLARRHGESYGGGATLESDPPTSSSPPDDDR